MPTSKKTVRAVTDLMRQAPLDIKRQLFRSNGTGKTVLEAYSLKPALLAQVEALLNPPVASLSKMTEVRET